MSSEKFTFFYKGPLSQWSLSPFTVDEVEYNCAEQYMMAEKARLFGDRETWEKILATDSPKKHQELGRQVLGFDEEIWEAHARNIVYDGNWAKFSQSENHRNALMLTAGTTLVEASPVDQLWGIGLSEKDPRALNRSTWRGRNWLGEVLTIVRINLTRKLDLNA
jgi:ribA/ribD-fused uncharacterized protein